MWEYVDTPFALVCQHDGFILNKNAWNDEWLKNDYIGCHSNCWSGWGENGQGGNGGFSLRSKRLMEFGSKNIKIPHPEDTAYSNSITTYNGCRELLEDNGFIIANNKIQYKFGCETNRYQPIDININDLPFGIHGCQLNEHHPALRKE